MWRPAIPVLAGLALVASAGAGPQSARIAPVRENVELVAKLRLTSVRGGIGDVSELRGFAYLAAWNPECPRGGVHVVDIRDPARPEKVAFVPAPAGYYVGEGVHLLSLRSASFTGDVLLSNHEPCSSPSPGGGGFSLTDVTEPGEPKPLSGLVGDLDAPDGTRRRLPNPSHSVQGWTDGDRAYAVLVDNAESQAVDIFEITDPRHPRQIAETGLDDFADAALPRQHGNELFFHDVQFERVEGKPTLLLSYWDAGWILLDVSDPSRPTLFRDHDFATTDPLFGVAPPEGNAHQAYWSSDQRYILGATEDLRPFRLAGVVASGPFAGLDFEPTSLRPAGRQAPLERSGPSLRGDPLRERVSTVYAGFGCSPLPRRHRHAVALVERGGCELTDKVAAIAGAGYGAAIVFNSRGTGNCEASVPLGGIRNSRVPVFGIPRSVGLAILGLRGYDAAGCRAAESPPLPAPGREGAKVVIRSIFDGWGYVHLLDGQTFQELAHYAVAEGQDPLLADRSSEILSVHEVKTDPRPGVSLGYIAYYDAGARVVAFGANGISEVGRFVDTGGNRFWGTFPVARGGERPLWLLSDMNFGLYVLRYTGREPG